MSLLVIIAMGILASIVASLFLGSFIKWGLEDGVRK